MSMADPKPLRGGTPKPPARPDVERGDKVYVNHPTRGPISVEVRATGADGLRARCDAGKQYRIPWGHVLGHKARVNRTARVVDQGADGAIIEDDSGKRRFVTGELPVADKAQPKPPERRDDPLRDPAPMRKASPQPAGPVLILKAMNNRPGLQLQRVTDKKGRQTQRWKRTSKDEPAAKHDAPIEHGQVVAFRHGDVGGSGKIIGSGADGVTLLDQHGVEHQVRHEHLVTSGPGKDGERIGTDAAGQKARAAERIGTDAAGQKARAAEGNGNGGGAGDDGAKGGSGGDGPSDGDGGGIPPDRFKASDIYKKFDQANVTADDIYKEFTPETAQKIRDADGKANALKTTAETFKKGGVWSPERLKIHAKIIASILTPERVEAARPAEGQAPTFIILGGRGGSGKSWFKNRVYDPDKTIALDADEIKRELPEYRGFNASQVHEESGDIFDTITQIAQDMGLNVVHDATMKTPKKAVGLVKSFKETGHRVEAHYMFLPRQEAAKRAVNRFMREGRLVPPEVVLLNTSNEDSFDAIKDSVDAWSFRDNNVARGEQPRLISEKKGNGNRLQRPEVGRHGLQASGGAAKQPYPRAVPKNDRREKWGSESGGRGGPRPLRKALGAEAPARCLIIIRDHARGA